MASAFLSSIRSKTSQVLGLVRRWAASPSSSFDPHSSVLEDLKKLERTLKRILAVLHDAEEREIRENAIKLWLEELKQVAHDADDVLDEYHYEELQAQVEGRASRKRKHVEGDGEEEVSGSLSTTVLIPYGMRDRIREIRERFDEISFDRERLCLREEDGERRASGAAYLAPSSHMVDESKIYGRGDDKDKVIDLLLSEGMENGFSVIPIVGKGGLGKTTIAQLVYNDSNVKKCFNLTGWVCVSDDFNVPRLTKDIIESISSSETTCHVTQLSKLQNILNEKVKGKRVLLVLDDVWNEQPSLWEYLINPFVGAETVVRIIVTCRNDSVAEIMQTVRPYRPSYLSEEQSWLLFKQYAFGAGNSEEQPSLVDIGKQIVKKCSGLPLALKTIGSLLRCMTNEVSWVDVLESDLWEVDKNNETFTALRLSYDRMPTHLKPCFIYCSMFPKDYVFEKDALVRLWMAQGYITPQGRRRLEDIGNEYFNDLQRRSFFDSFDDGFKMHDIIHDLAKSIAGNECCTVDGKLGGFPNEIRHLYLQNHGVKSLSSYHSRALRTLITWDDWFGCPAVIEHPLLIIPMIGCLRTLWSRWESVDELSGSIGNLKHLRYLHIGSESIKRLPESVCLLYHLQTLILECHNLAELPDGLNNLINLRHLKLLKISSLPAGVDKLTNLQSLCGDFKVRGGEGQDGIRVLKNLVDLQGTLCISGLRNLVKIENARNASLKSKHQLEHLFLNWFDWLCGSEFALHLAVSSKENKDIPPDEKMEETILEYLQPHTNLKKLHIRWYCGSKFPKWVGDPFSLASLQEITIFNCKNLRSLPLYVHDPLGKLDTVTPKEPLPSMLTVVRIFCCVQLTSIEGLHNLHSLKTLDICSCPQLELKSEEGLPLKLERLHVEECKQLALLPGLQNFTSLRYLHIRRCPRLRIMAEDKVSTMPDDVEIEDCPGLINWCQIQKINCIEVHSPDKLTVSNNWKIIKHEFDDFSSIRTDEMQQPRSWLARNSWNFFSYRRCLIKALTICSCASIPPVKHQDFVPRRFHRQRLVIKDCPDIKFLPDDLLLPTVGSLIIDNCENLRNLLLAQHNRDELEELQIVNCSKLTKVEGLSFLSSLKTLRINGCPNLWLSQDDSLPFVPPCIEIVGVLQNEIYSPHLAEADNRETIDDGRQQSQS